MASTSAKNLVPVLFLACVTLSFGSAAVAEEWPHFRGPNRNGVIEEPSGFVDGKWPLQEAWTAEVGEGSSSPIVVDGRLYTMGWRDGEDRVVCLDATTGKTLWSKAYASPRYGRNALGDQGLYSGPQSTPEYDAETGSLFTLGVDGDLHAWKAADGELLWRVDLHDAFDVQQRPQVGRSGHRDYGFVGSPLALGNAIVVEVGAKQGTLIAFDKRTGKQSWASAANSPAGHTGGPVPMTVEGMPCVALHDFDGLLVVRTDGDRAGETVATYPWVTAFANNVASPAIYEDTVILTSAYDQQRIARLRVRLGGVETIWERDEASKICTPVVRDGYVYWAWQRMYCLDLKTGETVWQGGAFGDAGSCIATADDRLIVWSKRGDLALVDAATRSPKEYREVASLKRLGREDAWPHVAMSDGRIFCKDRTGKIVCLTLPR
ncbi:MAG TPA: PQQ-binding-like beta-propeller repeat protein [Pirellulaceae bacterium]|jgi:outer membrane protein assembly factor BamB|nr:PQQ-binding-like beta-propeller repeat protein [Pirellulaceae bacterium]